MPDEIVPVASSFEKIYRVSSGNLLRLAFERLAKFIVIIALTSGVSLISGRANYFFSLWEQAPSWYLIYIVYLVVFCALVRREHLVITPQGITYYSLRGTLTTGWDNLKSIEAKKTWQLTMPVEEVIRLHQPATEQITKGLVWLLSKERQRNEIPLSEIDYRWREGKLAGDLCEYVPHLFQVATTVPKENT
jgi:hypothetical protein